MITTTETLQAFTDAFNAAGIDTPEALGTILPPLIGVARGLQKAGFDTAQKGEGFVTIAALQVKMNTLDVELQKLAQTQAAALADQQAARELKIAEKNATQATLLALVAAQS